MPTSNQIYFRIKSIPISVFGYFIIHKLNIQKGVGDKKWIEDFFKLILNIVNFLCQYKFMPWYVTMATTFSCGFKKD